MSDHEFHFERAFSRLEEILERMNSGAVSLDESLLLYEEADRLIAGCSRKLKSAETKIEMLIKRREGEIQLDVHGQPQVELFQEASL